MFKKSKHKIIASILIAIPLVLWILPAGFFDNSEFIICPSRRFFDIECFGCGMTRAVMHIHHFDFQEAFYYNYGSLLIYPALIYVWFVFMKKALTGMGVLPFKKK